jgi:hypothetical protein
VLYQRDYLHLLVKYGLEPPSQLVAAGVPEDGPPLRLDADRAVAVVDRRRPAEQDDPTAESA